MSTLHNEEIRAMRITVSFLRKRIALESSQSKKAQMRKDVDELENMILQKLNETSDFATVKIEEDAY